MYTSYQPLAPPQIIDQPSSFTPNAGMAEISPKRRWFWQLNWSAMSEIPLEFPASGCQDGHIGYINRQISIWVKLEL
jgi:hypothetical protein